MPAFFTDPDDDELLYSACARFSDKLKYPNAATAAQVLFGVETSAVVDLPTKIDYLISVLPKNHQYTSDIFIDKHTHFPYYAPFLPSERVQLLRSDMRGNEGSHIRERLGITAGCLTPPVRLRFCPECVKEDPDQNRETYWRRLHQLPGVEVCPNHEVFLEESNALRINGSKFTSASRAAVKAPTRRLKKANLQHSLLLKIAINSAWLLNWHGPYPGSEVLSARYHNILLKNGFAYYNGRIRTNKLLDAFVKYYSPALLAQLQCSIGSQRISWLLRLLMPSKAAIVKPPLHHILLMIFLNCNAEEVFTKFEEFKPFGEGPWPCLNPVAKHYQQMLITECRVTDSPVKGKAGRPRGDFHCSCGFIYTRTGPDTSEKDKLRFDSVISYGQIWEKALHKQWNDRSKTMVQIAENLGLIPFSITRHAIRLGLPFPRQSPGSRPTSKQVIERYSNTRKTLEEARERYRQEWLTIRKANPKAGRLELISLSYYTYWWLRRNDVEWLEENIPPSQTPLPPPTRVDWESVDKELSMAVGAAVSKIKGTEGRPVRVSVTAIIKEVGHRAWIEKCLDRLPLTDGVISENLESYKACSIRRVQWAVASYQEKGKTPTRLQLMVRAGVRTKAGNTPEVQSEIDAAMESLKQR